jgi:Methyltransferase domain
MPIDSTIPKAPATKEMISTLGLPLPTFVPRRFQHRNVSSWSGHLAFASDLIRATEPEIIVELGTHWGEAYFTFCQTVQDYGLGSLCYAVDHWMGDEHAGRYGEEVYEDVRQYNERYYRQFSYLLRMSFDEALSQFSDHTIGLLHVDGFHTYEAAKHDFLTWLPKVKPGGIIMLHDISPKHEDFGVWQLWDEIKAEYPETFEFHHGWGLGVMRKPGEGKGAPLTDYLFHSTPAVQEEVRRRYVIYSSHLENLLAQTAQPAAPAPSRPPEEIRVQVFPFGATGFSEETALLKKMKPGTWSTLVFELPDGIGQGLLRIDPAHDPGIIEVDQLQLHSMPKDELVWDALTQPESLQLAGTVVMVPREAGLLLISTGNDPQLILNVPSSVSGAVKLTISLHAGLASQAASETILGILQEATGNAERAQREAQQQVEAAQRELETNSLEVIRAVREKDEVQARLRATEEKLRGEADTRASMEQSLSWKATQPIRSLMNSLRSGPRKNS